MKVAYNACYGGFSLSNLALDKFAEKKGIKLFWYNQEDHGGIYKKVYDALDGVNRYYNPFMEDMGESFSEIKKGTFYYASFHEDESRTDKDLIDVIEELGDKASGSCSELSIAEIPDGADFEIDDYDGFESVEPPRQSW